MSTTTTYGDRVAELKARYVVACEARDVAYGAAVAALKAAGADAVDADGGDIAVTSTWTTGAGATRTATRMTRVWIGASPSAMPRMGEGLAEAMWAAWFAAMDVRQTSVGADCPHLVIAYCDPYAAR